MDLTEYEAHDIVANAEKNTLGGMAKNVETIRSDGREKKTKLAANEHFSWTAVSSGT